MLWKMYRAYIAAVKHSPLQLYGYVSGDNGDFFERYARRRSE